MPHDLHAEAEMLSSRCSLERADYLFEVAHLAHRGPAEAEALQRLVGDLLAANSLSKSAPGFPGETGQIARSRT